MAQRESASFTPRRSLVRSQYRPPSSPAGCDRTTGRFGSWCSSKVQQRSLGIRVEPLTELLKRLAGGRRGNLGIDLHRDGDLAVPQDLHREARVHVERGQQRTACLRVPCTVITGTLAAVMHRLKLRLKFRGSIGVPCRVVKTSPVSIQAAPARARSASCCRLRILSTVTHKPGSGKGASDVSVLTSRRRSWPPTRWSCSPTYSSPASRSTSSQVSPSTSPLRRPRTRIRTKAAYSASPACQVDSRNQRASSTVQAWRFRCLASRRLESFTAVTGLRVMISSSTAQVSYGSCRSLFGQRIGVGLPALVSLPGAVLVAAAP